MPEKWGREKFIFHAIIPALYSMLESQSLKKQNSNQNVKAEKMVLLVKTFDHYDHTF